MACSSITSWQIEGEKVEAVTSLAGVFPYSSVSKESAHNTGDPGLIPGSGRSPGEGNGNSLQYSCLENPMDRSLAGYNPWGYKSQTRLRN